jgi:hypothetical protein
MPNDILDNNEIDEQILGAEGPKYNKDLSILEEGSTSDKDDEVLIETDEEDKEEKDEIGKVEEKIEQTEEEKQDNEKLTVQFDIPTFGEIKAKYPEIVKDFPGLRGLFYQAAEISKIFPSVEDAKEALEDNEAFVSLRESVISGESDSFIDALKSQSEETLSAFGYNFLVKLSEKDNKAYFNVVTPLFENLIRYVFDSSKDEDVKNAALVFSEALFGTSEVAEGKKTFAKKIEIPKPKDDSEIFNKALNEVGTKTNNVLATIINEGFSEEDKKALTPYLRKSIVKETIEELWAQLAKDSAHASVMKSRWNRAKLNGYSEDDKTKIISTLLVRAKSLIPSIRTKLKNDALGITAKASKDKIEKIQSKITRKEVSGGPSSTKSSDRSESSQKNGKVDYRKMSDLDILEL